MAEIAGARIRLLFWVALFAALTAVGGMIRIPVPPVPMTLQTLFVYLAGDVLGKKKGSASQVLFLFLGLAGVPVFAHGGGPAYVLQPTFGYILGFPVAAWTIGMLVERRGGPTRWWYGFFANGVGLLVILFLGVIGLYANMNFIVQKELSLIRALWLGALIFLPGELIKMALAAALAERLCPLLEQG